MRLHQPRSEAGDGGYRPGRLDAGLCLQPQQLQPLSDITSKYRSSAISKSKRSKNSDSACSAKDLSWVTLDTKLADYVSADEGPARNAEVIAAACQDLKQAGVDLFAQTSSDGEELHFVITLRQAILTGWSWDTSHPSDPYEYLASLIFDHNDVRHTENDLTALGGLIEKLEDDFWRTQPVNDTHNHPDVMEACMHLNAAHRALARLLETLRGTNEYDLLAYHALKLEEIVHELPELRLILKEASAAV